MSLVHIVIDNDTDSVRFTRLGEAPISFKFDIRSMKVVRMLVEELVNMLGPGHEVLLTVQNDGTMRQIGEWE